MASIFSKIVAGTLPAYKVAETDECLAFLDIYPLAKGHTLVIPKREIDYLFDLDNKLYIQLQLFAKTIAQGIKKAIPCKRIGLAVVGLEQPHAHIHLIPINEVADMSFARKKCPISAKELEKIAESIKHCIQGHID